MKKTFIAHKNDMGQTQTVEEHLMETARLAEQFSGKVGLPQMGYLAGLLHDLGKYSEEFYERIMKNGPICDHSTAGAQHTENLFKDKEFKFSKTLVCLLQTLILSHHGGLIDAIDFDGNTPRETRLQKDLNLQQVIDNANESVLSEAQQSCSEELFRQFENIMNSIKEEGKKEESQELIYFYISLLTKFLFSCLVDADRKDTISCFDEIKIK